MSVVYPTIGYTDPTAYTVYREANEYYARNNEVGNIEFTGPDPGVVVQACLTAGGAGTVVSLRENNFVALSGVAMTANNQGVVGLGEGTYWDGTTMVAGIDAFSIIGFTGCRLSNFVVETNAGGGGINVCVWIEDGADDFHLHGLTIIDSNGEAISISGTTITQGHIHDCHVLGADGAGILVDMDAANFMYRLRVEDCDILDCGTRGIDFATSGGNHYCEIVNNNISGCTSDGIQIIDGDYSLIRGNSCINNGSEGLEVNSTDHANIVGNLCEGNTRNGIYVTTSHYCTVSGNTCNGNTREGIDVAWSDDCTLSGNTFTGNTRSGIALSPSNNSTVSGNTCNGNTRSGIEGSTMTNCTVSGNTCNGNTWRGIWLTASEYCTVTGNTCNENVEYGIFLAADFCTIAGNTCIGNDSGDTGNFDGINLTLCDRILVVGNQCQDQQGWGIQVDNNSNWCKISNNYTNGNVAGSINVNGATCDGNQVEFNTVEEGAPVDTGTLTRAYGNFDPSANVFVGDVGAAPF